MFCPCESEMKAKFKCYRCLIIKISTTSRIDFASLFFLFRLNLMKYFEWKLFELQHQECGANE